MSLQVFIEKARIRDQKKKKAVKIEVNDFGEVEFFRPKEEVIIDFMDNSSEKGTKEMARESSKFVYLSCPDLQSKEVREEFEIDDPLEAPLAIFGAIQTIEVAASLLGEFGGSKIKEEIEEAVKNS